MIKRTDVVKDWQDAGALNTFVNLYGFVDDFLLSKSGDLLAVLKADPLDYECLPSDGLADVTHSFEAALRPIDPLCRIHQYTIKRSGGPVPMPEHHPNEVVDQANRARADQFEARADDLYTIETYFVIVYEGSRHQQMLADRFRAAVRDPISAWKRYFSTQETIALIDEAITRGEQVLLNKVNSFVVQMRDSLKLRLVPKAEAFTFYRRLMNFDRVKADSVPLQYDSFVDYFVCDSGLECHRNYLRLDDYYVKIHTLKDPPAQTYPNMLRLLQELQSQFVIAMEFHPVDNLAMRGVIKAKQRHAFNSKKSLLSHLNFEATSAPVDQLVDESKGAWVDQLSQCLTDLEMQGGSIGQFTLTVILYDKNWKRLQKASAEAFKSLAGLGAILYEEGYNQLNAFFAMLPGGARFNLRELYLPTRSFADLALLFAPHPGEPVDRHLRADCLATLETRQKSLFSFSLHHNDLAHTILLGPSGMGKSFILNFLITSAQKYTRIRTMIFDIGGSYEMLTRQFGGSYMPVAIKDRQFKINPFSLPPTPINLQFLFSFVKVLMESSGTFTMTDQDERELFTQIASLYHVDPSQRRLMTLLHILPKHLEPHLRRWTEGGQYGDVFDNADDSLTFAPFQAFDFAGMGEFPQIIEPLLFYILHRATAEISDPVATSTFKMCVIDEAWLFFRNPTVKQYIVEALKTWRKANAAMILATQSVVDLSEQGMVQIVADSAANQILLANPRLDRRQYRDCFGLNETELDLVAGLIPKKEMLIKRPGLSKVVELNVSAKDYWLYTNNSADNDIKRRAFEELGLERGLDYLAKQRRAIDNPMAEQEIERTEL